MAIPKSVITFHRTTANGTNEYFLSTDHCQRIQPTSAGTKRIPKGFVPVTTYLPYQISPRPGFEDGIIKDKDEYLRFLASCGNIEVPNPDSNYQP